MQTSNLNNMIRGWFVGNFEPSVYKTGSVEAAVKCYKAGEIESRHYHKIATEITVIVAGKVRMNEQEYIAGEIIQMEPGEDTDFEAVIDSITVIVKIPGALNDKYEISKNA